MATKLVQTDSKTVRKSAGQSSGPDNTGDHATDRAAERVEQVRQLAAAWSDRLRAYARSVVHSPHAAADVVQDVLMRLCDPNCPSPPLDDLNSPPLRGWLFTAVRNRGIDYLRKEGRMNQMGESHDPKASTPSPAQAVEERDAGAAAMAALDQLPPLQRDALRLRFSGNMSYKQIAEATGKTVSHVGVLIHEGLKALRSQLDSQFTPPEPAGAKLHRTSPSKPPFSAEA